MRVLVNGLSIGSISGRHVLYGHLRQLAGWTVNTHQYVVLTAPGETQPFELKHPNIEWLTASEWSRHWATRQAWESWALPGLIKQQRIDLYFTPSGTIQYRIRVPQVSLAQNPWPLMQAIHRGAAEHFKARQWRAAFRRAHLSADIMAFNSRHIHRLYQANAGGQPCRRDLIAYQGINDSMHEHGEKTRYEAKQPLTILSVSAMAYWKGAEFLVRALEQIRRHVPALVRFVGPWPDAQYERLVRHEIQSRGLSNAVTLTGRVSSEQLQREYAKAKVFCLMSQCESFGIPAVEAQIHGLPVVGSVTSAMPEICGPGGVFHKPLDISLVANSLERLLTDSVEWEKMSVLARENATKYRWELCSRPLLKMFEMASICE